MGYAQETCNMLLSKIREVQDTYNENKNIVLISEKAIFDLLHEIELGTHDTTQMVQIYTKIKDLRLVRRKAKVENRELDRLVECINNNTTFNNNLIKCSATIKKEEFAISNLTFNPRIRTDLSIAGAHQDVDKEVETL